MTGQGQLILGQPFDLPALGHFFTVFAHGQASARLAIARQQRLENIDGRTFNNAFTLAPMPLARLAASTL